jgi:UDP-N-acetylmuramate--alanine ligase
MINNPITKARRIHFIGIGGIGVSALAKLLNEFGVEVSGSDMTENPQTKELRDMGLQVTIGHIPGNIRNQDYVVHSLAIPRSNIELKIAREKGIKTISYPQAIGMLTKEYNLIAVAGTHGKTTTTGMLGKLMLDLDFDPTIIVGSTASYLQNQNFRKGDSNWFVLEACEYHSGFLYFEPEITIITNLEHDHFDAYPEEKDYLDAFQKLVDKTKSAVILNTDLPLANKLHFADHLTVIEYKEGDESLQMNVPGKHNVTNATAVMRLAEFLEIKKEDAEESLIAFEGTGRRLELVSDKDGQMIFDDYGHHPTEIKATLQALKERFPNKKICVIFQAHQHNRTIALLEGFTESFKDADKVVIPDIYKARDTKNEIDEMSAEKFAQAISKKHNNVLYSESLESTKKHFAEITKGYEIALIMGAGNVDKIIR